MEPLGVAGHIAEFEPVVARQCRICEAVCQRLDIHLKRKHGVNARSLQYREELNLAPVSTRNSYYLNIFQKYSNDEI